MVAIAGVLAELGAPTAAARYLNPVPMEVQANQAGELVRWGHDVTPPDPRRRFESTDKALARLDQLLAQARASRNPTTASLSVSGATACSRCAIANGGRKRCARPKRCERRATRSRPTSAKPRRTRCSRCGVRTEARRGYEEVLRADPTVREAQIGRFFALVEEENLFAAIQQADEIAALEKPGVREPKQAG